jgi:DNA-binding response OmpR family regulator
MKKILLIEDDADIFTLVQYNLEKEGFAFAGAKTGRARCSCAAARSPT